MSVTPSMRLWRRSAPPASPIGCLRRNFRTRCLLHRAACRISSRVEDLGYLRRLTDPVGGRGVIVELTPAGFELSQVTVPAQAELERALIVQLSPQRKGIARLLAKPVDRRESMTRGFWRHAPQFGVQRPRRKRGFQKATSIANTTSPVLILFRRHYLSNIVRENKLTLG